MHPAYSVIFFTTATGAGYGLLILLASLALAGAIPPAAGFGIAAFGTSLALITAGLLASTAHLSHRDRAWRALSQWRSSWLSREGVAAVATYLPASGFAFGWIVLERNTGFWAGIGLSAAILAFATVVCTAMIYASLKPVPRWHNRWVVPVYVAFALALGAVLLAFLMHAFGFGTAWMPCTAAGLVAAAWAIKWAYWRDIDRAAPVSSAESATGLGRFGEVRQLESPHTSPNYVMKEMGYRIARRHARRLRGIAVGVGGATPIMLLLASLVTPPVAAGFLLAGCIAAAASGTLLERWLFFAEAQHVVIVYYGARAA